MNMIARLINLGHIRKGTWVGVRMNNHHLSMTLVVEATSSCGTLVAVDPTHMRSYQVPPDLICEVDGMQVSRFLAQADLLPDGTKPLNITRRGRKRKVTV
jgi:hypothetical protein